MNYRALKNDKHTLVPAHDAPAGSAVMYNSKLYLRTACHFAGLVMLAEIGNGETRMVPCTEAVVVMDFKLEARSKQP